MGRVKAADGLEQPPFKMLLELMKNPKCWVKICGAERVSSEGPAVHRRGAVRARADRRGARARAVGHRLAASEREMDAGRRGAARAVPADGARRRRCRSRSWWIIRPDSTASSALLHEPAVADDERLAGQRVGRECREEQRGFGDVLDVVNSPSTVSLSITFLMTSSSVMPSSFACSGICFSTSGVRTKPGQITLARTPCLRAFLGDHLGQPDAGRAWR